MNRIIKTLRDNNIECLPNERLSLSVEMFDTNGQERTVPKSVLYENPNPISERLPVTESKHSNFRYFLDGSERFYPIIDASFGGSYLPICAAQVGVTVIERTDDGKYRVLRERSVTSLDRLLLFPSGQIDERAIDELESQINDGLPTAYHFTIVKYSPRSMDSDKEPAELARAAVLKWMHERELNTVSSMLAEGLINGTRWLAFDGGLQFRQSQALENLIANDLFARYVVGLAKQFEPSRPIKEGAGRKSQDVGNLIKGLDYRERTPAFSNNTEESFIRGSWYLRIRQPEYVYQPLQGVIKIEVFADQRERFGLQGLDFARVDGISQCVIRERNVTPYKSDDRWGNHLYPIYLAERFLKSSFLSTPRFKALII